MVKAISATPLHNLTQLLIMDVSAYHQRALKAQLNLARGRVKRHPGVYVVYNQGRL